MESAITELRQDSLFRRLSKVVSIEPVDDRQLIQAFHRAVDLLEYLYPLLDDLDANDPRISRLEECLYRMEPLVGLPERARTIPSRDEVRAWLSSVGAAVSEILLDEA